MENVNLTLTIIANVASVVLAIVAIFLGINARKESRKNYDETKDLLAKIDTMSSVIKETVSQNFQDVLTTVLANFKPKRSAEESVQEMFLELVKSGRMEDLDKITSAFSKFQKEGINKSL